jgi:hypothetical protein
VAPFIALLGADLLGAERDGLGRDTVLPPPLLKHHAPNVAHLWILMVIKGKYKIIPLLIFWCCYIFSHHMGLYFNLFLKNTYEFRIWWWQNQITFQVLDLAINCWWLLWNIVFLINNHHFFRKKVSFTRTQSWTFISLFEP